MYIYQCLLRTVETSCFNGTTMIIIKALTFIFRNAMICKFGYEKVGLFVSIKEEFYNEANLKKAVREFLEKYMPNADKIDIKPLKNRVVKNLGLKSGDSVNCEICPKNEHYGTVGLSLTDGNHNYCATCKHVFTVCLGQISTPTHDCSDFIVHTQEENVKTDKIYTPSKDLDFSAIRLVENNVKICSGLINKEGNLVDGTLLSHDMRLVPYEQIFYKWGAKTGLTKGTFKGINEEENKSSVIEIENICRKSNFAERGDSGSLICFSDNQFELAAFILTGCVEDNPNVILGYRLSDALKSCKVHPFLKKVKTCLGREK